MYQNKNVKTLWEALSSPANFPNYDANTGAGYGILRPKNHFPRQSASTYPYKSPVDDDELDAVEEETVEDPKDQAKFRNKVGSVGPSDTLSTRSVDNQYFVGAATPFDMFGEAVGRNSSKGSISAIPNAYAGKEAVVGGSNSWNSVQKPIQHTRGTKKGYSSALQNLVDVPQAWEEDFFDDNDPVSNIRRIVRTYHDLNLLRK